MEQFNLAQRTALVTLEFYQLNEKARKSDIWTSLAAYINQDDIYSIQKNIRDIFYYGLMLCNSGVSADRLDKILTNLIVHEKDEEKRKLKLVQKEAVMHFCKGSNSKLFLLSLFSYFTIEEINEVRKFLADSFIAGLPAQLPADELKSLLEKPYIKEKTIDANENTSGNPVLPFSSFIDVDKNILLEQLKKETPILIANVLSLIDPKKAAFILSNFSTGLQIETAANIAALDIPTFELFIDLYRLEKQLLSQESKEYKNPDSDEFKKLLQSYLVRDDAVNSAYELYKKASMISAGGKEAADLTKRLTDVMQGRAVDFIKTNPPNFLKLLEEEHPKTISLILSALEPDKAAIFLQFLPDYLKCDAGRRIALMDKSDVITPEMLGDLNEIPEEEIRRIEKKLSAIFDKTCVLEGGMKKLADLLFLCDKQTEKTIMEFIEKCYPELMETINDYFFAFEDIVILSDPAVQKVLRCCDINDLTIALYETSDDAREKIFNNLSKRAAIMLKEDIDCLKSASPEDVKRAKKNIVSIIRRLEETGEIILADSDD